MSAAASPIEWRARGRDVVGSDVQGRASAAASAASTEGGENSPSERTLFFAPAGTTASEVGVKLPSDKRT